MEFKPYTLHPETGPNNAILLLDPDEDIQMLYRDELSGEGYEVIPVNETSRVIHYIMTYQPILLVMEPGLYGRNGLRLLRDIRQAHPDLPVIVCTADPSFKTEPNAQIADDVVLKGMSVAGLKQSIQNVLAVRNRIKGSAGYPSKKNGTLGDSTRSVISSDIADLPSAYHPSLVGGNIGAKTNKKEDF